MCGIVGYVGFREATDVLLEGLRRLEYRGYDSAGVAVKVNDHLEVVKKAGKLQVLADELKAHKLPGKFGVGHTRWATHGAPTDPNAHPHMTEQGDIAVIHNGIIENYLPLKEGLIARGHVFTSETDSEVLAHLIEEKYRGNLAEAVRLALSEAYGAYALVVAHKDKEEIVVARTVSPLVIGLGEGENFVASEYRYRDPVVDEKTLAIAISQSGETIDTLEGLREAKRKGAGTLGIINAKGSSITRETDDTLYIHAGPEIGVASTKAYMAMLAAMGLVAVWMGRAKGALNPEAAREFLAEMRKLPRLVEEMLEHRPEIAKIAEKYHQAQDYLFLDRHIQAPTAFEGALKLKEISYIHAEAYPAGEMKHGPIALIDERLPVVVLATQSPFYEKTVSNIQEVRARGGRVIAVATEGDTEVKKFAQDVIYVPKVHHLLAPVVSVVPLQLLAYETAVFLGRDVDQPRNLAKSVTVE